MCQYGGLINEVNLISTLDHNNECLVRGIHQNTLCKILINIKYLINLLKTMSLTLE